VHALLQTMRARLVAQKRGFATIELQGPKLVMQFAEAYQPDQEGLVNLVPLFKRTMRYVATKPLQIAVELNPPKGDNRQAIDQAVQVLRGLWPV
jgi:transcription-repair coupling factor (superfamily II helicase)